MATEYSSKDNRRSMLCSFCVEIMAVELMQLCANYSSSIGTERANMFVTLHCVLHDSNSHLVIHTVNTVQRTK